MPDEVTLDDVARSSGVSRATASRALNGREGVRHDVRERVKLVAEGLGYRPNRAARNLAGGRASVIGLVLGRNELREAPYELMLMQSVATEADRRDEGLMLIMDNKEPSLAVRRLLADGLVDGVIVSVVAAGSNWVEELLDANIPTVLIGFHPGRSDVAVVEVENRRSSARLVEHLIDSGCKRVATVTGNLRRRDAQDRLEGYRDAHRTRSLDVDENLILQANFFRREGYDLTDQLLATGADGVFAANDELANGIYIRAIELGISVPEELSIAGFDGVTTNSATGPYITSMAQPFRRMASTAVDVLIGQVTGGGEPQTHVLDPEIYYGTTTRQL